MLSMILESVLLLFAVSLVLILVVSISVALVAMLGSGLNETDDDSL